MTDWVKKFFKAGLQRLNAAEALYDLGGLELDALYLGGYAVECSMKSIILKQVPHSKRQQFLKHFSGQRAHDIEFLKHLWKQNRCEPLPKSLAKSLPGFVSCWSTDLRYEVGRGNAEDTANSLEFARNFVVWVQERIE